jgi:hypothetical protein
MVRRHPDYHGRSSSSKNKTKKNNNSGKTGKINLLSGFVAPKSVLCTVAL